MTTDELADFAFTTLWNRSGADRLTEMLARVQFDTAVNFGSSRAIQFFQRGLGSVVVDGIFSPQTRSVAGSANPIAVAKRYLNLRLAETPETGKAAQARRLIALARELEII
jgi:lysozyme family protein